MIVLDTNVMSELLRPQPEPRVVAWMEGLGDEAALTAITVAELLTGLARLPQGNRRRALASAVHSVLDAYRGTRSILPFGEAEAPHYAHVVSARLAAGRPISTADAQIAAICLASGAVCATRNLRDFEGTGLSLVNPWAA